MHILWCMGSKFCVKFQRAPLKIQTKFWTHTSQNMHFKYFWFAISWNCDVISLSETAAKPAGTVIPNFGFPIYTESALCVNGRSNAPAIDLFCTLFSKNLWYSLDFFHLKSYTYQSSNTIVFLSNITMCNNSYCCICMLLSTYHAPMECIH